MDCRGSLIYSHLLSPGLDPDDVHRGQLLTVMAAVSVLLLSELFVMLTEAAIWN